MERAIKMFDSGIITEIFHPINSFFHGARTDRPQVEIDTGHMCIFFKREMQAVIEQRPNLFIQWVEVIYFYFWNMAALPDLANIIWLQLWLTLDMLEQSGAETLPARIQMASWANFYDDVNKHKALSHIKAMSPSSQLMDLHRSAFLTTAINKGNEDYLFHINHAYSYSHLLHPLNRLQVNISYYIEISPSRELLHNILSILSWKELWEYRQGKMESLSSLYWTMMQRNDYESLLFFTRCLKLQINVEGFDCSHAFVFPNDEAQFCAISKSNLVMFSDKDNGESYFALIKLCNRLNKVAISLRGDYEVDFRVDTERFGIPSVGEDFEKLRQAVINHYHLDNDFYREVSLITLLPSHNHPLQGAICSLGVTPPLISVSLQNLAEEPSEKCFIFFLSSETFTRDTELAWIHQEFGIDAEVIIDPAPDLFVEYINNDIYTHVYISAHGIYSHWKSGEESIYFSEASQIPASMLKIIRRTSIVRRTIVLNICDGAASSLSFNHNNHGVAASLAGGNQVVISHLWPVNPFYACIFGTLVLRQLRYMSAAEAVLSIYSLLSQSNQNIVQSIVGWGDSYNEIAKKINNTSFEISDFRNIGSTAIYA
ncbi:hypothetical protein [Nitrosomonas communis]|nr:hypothetical protein [Nitrosomonas communis]